MDRYEIRKGTGRNRKNRGDVGGTGTRWFVCDTHTGLRMHGFGKTACADGGFLTKKAAADFISAITNSK